VKSIFIFILLLIALTIQAQDILIEAESFEHPGGWVVDPQFVEQMGSSYLLAHGLGKPVQNAQTTFQVSKNGNYNIWVRTMNWAPGDWEAPGRFQLQVNDYQFPEILGTEKGWDWQYVGQLKLKKGSNNMVLADLTGFDGRCDAIYLSQNNKKPPSDFIELSKWRQTVLQLPEDPEQEIYFDLVVTGGGIAGCATAIAAAEQGLNVALIHDRPVLGGNASGEIRVHTLGIYGHFERILRMLDTEHYPNGDPRAHEEDAKRMANIRKYNNIHLYLNWRAYNAFAQKEIIQYVDARQTSSGDRIRFMAPYFVDCTGDGWIGYWAKAEYSYGRESVNKYGEEWDKHGELWSPEKPDNFVMGSSILWRSKVMDSPSIFPEVPWALEVSKDYAESNGEWQWEFSRNDLHQIDNGEQIRDHMFKAIYGSFYNEKQKPGKENLALEWVSYLLGKRESRRLVGDQNRAPAPGIVRS